MYSVKNLHHPYVYVYIPDQLKKSKVVTYMIQKPGATDLSKIKSIRPISLLPLIGKTLERVILKI